MVRKVKQESPSRKSVSKRNKSIDAEARHQMIAVAAYYLAEKRGFSGDHSIQDWLDAEADINISLKS